MTPYAAYFCLDTSWPADLDAGRFFPLFESRVVAQTGISGGSHNNDLELAIIAPPAAFKPTGDRIRDAYLAWAGPAAQGPQRLVPTGFKTPDGGEMYFSVPISPPVRPLNDARLRVRHPKKIPGTLTFGEDFPGASLVKVTSDPLGGYAHAVYVNLKENAASVPTRLMQILELEGFVVHDAEAVYRPNYELMLQNKSRLAELGKESSSVNDILEKMDAARAQHPDCEACKGVHV